MRSDRSRSSSRRSGSALRVRCRRSHRQLQDQRQHHRRLLHPHPQRRRRAPRPFCSPPVPKFSTFAFQRTEISRTSSNGSRKLWASTTLRKTWPIFWRRRSISRSRRKTRRRGSSGGEGSSVPERRNLVQTRWPKKTSLPSLDTLLPKLSSESTNVTRTNASIVAVMGGDVRRGQGSTSTTRTRLASFTATRSPFSGCSAPLIMV